MFSKALDYFRRGKPISSEEKMAQTFKETKQTQQASFQIDKCSHHFRYLNKRSKKEKMPEGCMVCEKLIDCIVT